MSRTAFVFIRPATSFEGVVRDLAEIIGGTPEPVLGSLDDEIRVSGPNCCVLLFEHGFEVDGPQRDFPTYPVAIDVNAKRPLGTRPSNQDHHDANLQAAAELLAALRKRGHEGALSDDLNDLVPG